VPTQDIPFHRIDRPASRTATCCEPSDNTNRGTPPHAQQGLPTAHSARADHPHDPGLVDRRHRRARHTDSDPDLDAFIHDELIGPSAEACRVADRIEVWSARPSFSLDGTYINTYATDFLRGLVLAVLGADYPGNPEHQDLAADMLVFGCAPIVGPCLIIGANAEGAVSGISEQFARWISDVVRSAPTADATEVVVTNESPFSFDDEPPF
jgi:hypothetical protein